MSRPLDRIFADTHANPIADYVEGMENARRIVQCLTPTQFLIAFLRTEGYTDPEIQEQLGINRSCLSQHMTHAKKRIAETHPDLAQLLTHRNGKRLNQHRRIRTDNDN